MLGKENLAMIESPGNHLNGQQPETPREKMECPWGLG